jgi:hypothetical protein
MASLTGHDGWPVSQQRQLGTASCERAQRHLEGGMATDADLSMSPCTGRLLDGRYRVGALIGTGGMASVHAAQDLRLDRTVAVKLFQPNADETALARLTEEARLLAALSHPGLLRVFDISTSAGQPYLVMELIKGTTLRRSIDRGPIAPRTVAEVGTRLAATLGHVHSRHIVHRDIKPSNVLLDDSGAVYLADFGIARAMGAARVTAAGQCVGTAAYLAPEQVTGTEVCPAADIYALGLVLLECLTSRPEYPGSEVEAAVARLHRPPRVPDWLPPVWRATLTAMTAIDPRARPTAGRCAELLSAAATVEVPEARRPDDGDPPAIAAPTAPIRFPRPGGGRRPAIYLPAAVLAAAVAALGVLLGTGGAEPGQPVGVAPQPPTRPTIEQTISVPPTGSANANLVVVHVAPQAPKLSEPDNLGKADQRPGKRGKGRGPGKGRNG